MWESHDPSRSRLSTGRMRLAGTRHSRSAPVAVNACHNGTPRNSRSARTSWPGPQERGRRPTRVTSPVRQPASPQHPWGHHQHPHDLSRRTGPCPCGWSEQVGIYRLYHALELWDIDVENAIAADPLLDVAKTDYYSVRDDLDKTPGRRSCPR